MVGRPSQSRPAFAIVIEVLMGVFRLLSDRGMRSVTDSPRRFFEGPFQLVEQGDLR